MMKHLSILLLAFFLCAGVYAQNSKTPTSSTIVPTLAGKKGGQAIPKADLLAAGKIDLTEGAGAISYTVVIKGAKGTTSTYITPNKFNDDLKAKINKAAPGSKITFTKIYALTKSGIYVYTKPFTLTIK